MVGAPILVVVLGVYAPALLSPVALVAGSTAGRRAAWLVALVASLLVAGAAVCSFSAGGETVSLGGSGLFEQVYGVDSVSRLFLAVLAFIAVLVVVYSWGYMAEDPGYRRYYAALTLFTASMAGLVLARSLGMFYMFWEIVGLCSFTLIGHYYYSPRATRAAFKAFLVTRIGDIALLLAVATAYRHGVVRLDNIAGLPGDAASVFAGLAAVAVAAKAAQLPLHVWLPDAMEGPTPVSALLHSATMVKAGVYLAARLASLPATGVLHGLGLLALASSLYAAASALAQDDAKRLLAYSTSSNLGIIIAGLLLGGQNSSSALLHVEAHAVSKALLFLAVGVPIHFLEPLYGSERARLLATLRGAARTHPLLAASLVAGSASLAGLPPFAGFYGKACIAASIHGWAKLLLALASLLSAAYSGKLLYYLLVLEPSEPWFRPSPGAAMGIPLALLTAATLAPPTLLAAVDAGVQWGAEAAYEAALAVAGILLPVFYYRARLEAPPALTTAVREGLYFDAFYTRLLAPALSLLASIAGYGLVDLAERAEENLGERLVDAGRVLAETRAGMDALSLFYVLLSLGLLVAVAVAFLVAMSGGVLAP